MAADPDHGHQQLFADWVRDHGKAVRGFLLALVRRGDVADDLCQEVFCRAWQARDRYTDQGKTRAYLLQIANRLACDRSRRNEPQTNLTEEAWKIHEPPSSTPEPSQAAMLSEQIGLLHAALDKLAPMQQRVLLLRYYGQMDFQEIADTLQTPLNTALSHCRRGLGNAAAVARGDECHERFHQSRHLAIEADAGRSHCGGYLGSMRRAKCARCGKSSRCGRRLPARGMAGLRSVDPRGRCLPSGDGTRRLPWRPRFGRRNRAQPMARPDCRCRRNIARRGYFRLAGPVAQASACEPGAAVSPAKDSSETPSPTNTLTWRSSRRESTTPTEIATTAQPTTGSRRPGSRQPSSPGRAAKASTWDDPLDTQIATVSQEIRDVQQNWQHGVDDVDLVRYRIDEVSDSLQNDSL